MGHMALAGTIVRETSGEGPPVDSKHLVGVSLISLRVDTAQFQSSDLGKKREGMVAVSLAGQDSLFSYSGKGVVDISTRAQLCFLGKNPGPLAVDVRVIESDAGIRNAFAKMELFAETAKKVFSATSVPLVGHALGVGAAFFSLLKNLVKDTREATAFTVLDTPLVPGAEIRLKIGGQADRPLAELIFRIHDFGKHDTLRMTSVQICQPWFDLPEKRVSVRQNNPTGKGVRRKTYSIQDWLVRKKDFSNLVFSAGSGRHRAGATLPFAHLDRSHWQALEAFRVASGKAADQRIIPLAMSFSLRSDHSIVEPVLDFARSGVDLASEMDPQFAAAGHVLHKAGRSLGDIISELSPEAFALFQFDGALQLLPEKTDARGGIEHGLLQLPCTGPGCWEKDIVCELRMDRRDIGQFGFKIQVDLIS